MECVILCELEWVAVRILVGEMGEAAQQSVEASP
jgi:hypothetical protein